MSRATRRFIARHRRNSLIKWTARRVISIVRGYENLVYDPRYNGEAFLLRKLDAVSQRPTIFDVGANRGDWSKLALAACPAAELHAFELLPGTAEILRRNLKGAPVTINAFGLAETDGSRAAYVGTDDTRSTLIKPVESNASSAVADCCILRGDGYVAEHRIDRVDLLKIDTEGAEHLVLAGFTESLEAARIGAIQFEYGRANVATRFLLADFYDLLVPHEFAVGKLYPTYVAFKPYSTTDEDFLGPNYVAVHRDWWELYEHLL